MTENIILNVVFEQENKDCDIEVSGNITAHELIIGLKNAYTLDIDLNNLSQCFLRTENPIALLKGNKTLYEFGLHNGSKVFVAR